MLNIEIGAGNHQRKDFKNFDHRKCNYDMIFNELPVRDNSVNEIYMSHVLEHAPLIKTEEILRKLFKKIKPNGKIRIICPDLRTLCEAYLRGDISFFKMSCASTGDFERYGVGGAFLNNIVSFGQDTYLLDRTKKREIIGLAHCCAFDFEMLSIILKKVGFKKIIRSQYNPFKDYHKQHGQLFVEAIK